MKKKKIIIIGGIIIVLIIVAILVTIILLQKDDSEVAKNPLEDIFIELMNNNYKYYYYLYGDVNTTDGNIVIDNVTYYMVDDKNVVNIDEFDELISNTFTENIQAILLDVDEKNEYIEINDITYVKKMDNSCSNIKEYSFDNLIFTGDEEQKQVTFDNTSATINYENDSWKLRMDMYYCVQ